MKITKEYMYNDKFQFTEGKPNYYISFSLLPKQASSRVTIELSHQEWGNLVEFFEKTKDKGSLPQHMDAYTGFRIKQNTPIYFSWELQNNVSSLNRTDTKKDKQFLKRHIAFNQMLKKHLKGQHLDTKMSIYLDNIGDVPEGNYISFTRKNFLSFRSFILAVNRRLFHKK